MQLPRLTQLPPAPERGQDGAVFADTADTFLDAFPDLVDEINGTLLPAMEQAATTAAQEAADAVGNAFNPNNYYQKPYIDNALTTIQAQVTAQGTAATALAKRVSALETDSWFYRGY